MHLEDRHLKRAMEGADVKILLSHLRELGYYIGRTSYRPTRLVRAPEGRT